MIDVTSSWLARWSPFVALAAGVSWIVNEVAGRLSPDADDWDCNSSWDYLTNGLDGLAFWLTAAAVAALYVRQRHQSGTLGKVGAAAAFIGCLGAGINNPIEHCGDVEILGFVLWVPATLLLLTGLLVLSVATVRARVLPAWAGVALAIGVVALIVAFETGGWVVFGLSWIAVGYALWLAAERPQPSSAGIPVPPR